MNAELIDCRDILSLRMQSNLIYGFYSAPYLRLTYSKRNDHRLSEGQFQFINIRNQPAAQRTINLEEKQGQTSVI